MILIFNLLDILDGSNIGLLSSTRFGYNIIFNIKFVHVITFVFTEYVPIYVILLSYRIIYIGIHTAYIPTTYESICKTCLI